MEMLGVLPKYMIALQDNEVFSPPKKRTHEILVKSKTAGCSGYIILIANGLLAARFLQYVESERLINTRGVFLLLYDYRILQKDLHHIWNRIINVIFLRRYNAYIHRSGEEISQERIDLYTVRFPMGSKHFVRTKYVNTWHHGRLHYAKDHYPQRVTDLKKKKLRVAIFEHMPAVTKESRTYYIKNTDKSDKALGIEFELIQIIARALNFKPDYYMPKNIVEERWGNEKENHTYTGLLGEAIARRAAFFLGDLHYTMNHLQYLDLTVPYNTECLTFLTPESLTENSWKLLILPFKLYTWIALLFTLFLGGCTIHLFSLFYKKYISLYRNKEEEIAEVTIHHGKNERYNTNEVLKGLYLFTELQNSILYTYSMLLQVSLPRLPNPWAVRIFIGWWWLYSILLAVAYRASMTATLANPIARVTIDTLTQLVKSPIGVGGWSVESKKFFLSSADPISQKIGNRFELIKNEEESIERVTNGSFSYYENIYFLRHARVKNQVSEREFRQNNAQSDASNTKRYNLHIMEECVVNMPIAFGMEKNSPLKQQTDLWIRRIIEVGLVEKWLSDVMEWSKITEIRQHESEKALVNLRKLYGALVALVIGYFVSFAVLVGENLYWKHVVLKHPDYDKYHLDLFYSNVKK